MDRISLEKAIDVLERCGYKRSVIMKMDVYKFIDAVNKNIGTVESIEIIDLISKGRNEK